MQPYMLMKSRYIDSVDAKALAEVPPKDSYKNSLKINRTITPRDIYVGNSSNIYRTRLIYDLEPLRAHTGLSELFHGFTNMTHSGSPGDIPEFGEKLIDRVTVRTKNGTILMNYNFLHTMKMTDEANQWPTDDFNQDCTVWKQGTDSVYCPLFPWWNTKHPLPLRSMEPLEIEIIIKDLSGVYEDGSAVAVDILSSNFSLVCWFHDLPSGAPIGVTDRYNILYKPEYTIQRSYDLYYERNLVNIPIAASPNTVTIPITCPFPSRVMHVAIMDSTFSFKPISHARLTAAGQEIVNTDTRLNYKPSNRLSVGSQGDNFLSYWFSRLESRDFDSGLLEFTGSMKPTFLQVTYTSDVAANLYVWFEYSNEIRIDSDGLVKKGPSEDGFGMTGKFELHASLEKVVPYIPA